MHAPLSSTTRVSLAGDGTVEGYASLFGEVDQARDMVMPGAFTQTLQNRGLRRIPMLFQHDPSEPVGIWLDLHEDFRGLWARGRLIPDVARGRDPSTVGTEPRDRLKEPSGLGQSWLKTAPAPGPAPWLARAHRMVPIVAPPSARTTVRSETGSHGSRSRVDGYNVAVYGSYQPTDAAYLDAMVGYQWLQFDARRYVTDNGSLVHGSRDGNQWFASLSTGYRFQADATQLTPYGRLDMARASLDGYAETGDAGLIWEGHRAGMEIGYCHLEKLHNLEALPATGFLVSCFPFNIKGASAGFTRAVAILED